MHSNFLKKHIHFFNILSLVLLSACSSLSNREKRLALAATAFTAGAGIGSNTAPEGERKDLHSLYWAGLLGLGAAIAGNYIFDDETALQKSQMEIEKLKAELDLIQNSNKVLMKEGKGYFKNTQGEEFFQGGRAKWRLYQIDKWVKDGPNKLYHQDKMVELLPEESK